MAVSEQLKALVAQMPDPDRRGMFTENIDKEKIEYAVAQIAAGGPENVEMLIEMLGKPGSEENVKPHYALHCVVNHTLIQGDETARKAFCEVLASKLGDESLSDYNRGYLCQELQWAGRDEVCPALGKVLLNEALVEPACMALAAIGGERAARELRAALPEASGKVRLNLLDALADIADEKSAGAFQKALRDDDHEVRLAAGAGLAKLADPSAVDALIRAADTKDGWERIQQTKHCLVLAEHLAAAGQKDYARKIYRHLRDTRRDKSEKYIRDAAEASGLL